MKVLMTAFGLLSVAACAADAVLPGSQPLTPSADFSGDMVKAVDAYLLRQIDQAASARPFRQRTPQQNREILARMLGVVDARTAPVRMDTLADGKHVRWTVFETLQGEGVHLKSADNSASRLIYVPDADETPEQAAAGAASLPNQCEIVIPALINRQSDFSTALERKTGVSHRDWIYRQSFVQGRHPLGIEVQKVLALVDLLHGQDKTKPLVIAGRGEGGLVAMFAAALDERITSVHLQGCFAPMERLWEAPLERNIQGFLKDFGAAEIAALISPRKVVVSDTHWPQVVSGGEKSIAAPGKLSTPDVAEIDRELARAKELGAMIDKGELLSLFPANSDRMEPVMVETDASRQQRLVRETSTWCQRQLFAGETERHTNFWAKRPQTLSDYEQWSASQRDVFWKEVIGDLPWPNVPANPRSRLVKETDKVAIYEVVLDVWDGVFAWGWLALPKNLKQGEKRPVVVCQHGLEGIPEDCLNDDPESKAFKPYKAFAMKLAERGYITFSPHNLYRGMHTFRGLQRKLNLLGKSLFSVIIPQHRCILDWLKSQPWVDADRIAFYGLSYGGKSAMRIPAVLTDYCLSICSGDFNEWVRKCASSDMRMSYIFTHEYEIWEWNLGGTFNYAEMAALIAPRPFMVERGHDDGVGIDEWVNYEFAKVRRLYEKLKIGNRTTIEHFDGPHTINGVGTFEFLDKHLQSKR